MSEKPFNVDKAIEEINKKNIGGILKTNKEKENKIPFELLSLAEMSEEDISAALKRAKMSKDEADKILSISNKSKEDLASREIDKAINMALDPAVGDSETIIRLGRILEKNPQLKYEAKVKIERLIKEINNKIPGAKNEGALFDNVNTLVTIWEHFFKRD